MSGNGYSVVRSAAQYRLFGDRRPLLGHLDVELTERCNNACIHCYINRPAGDSEAAGRELTAAQWADLLRQAADLGALSVRFTGGEPLLRPDFPEIYLRARQLGMRVTLFTNARLITPAVADLLARVPPRSKIEVTVYGMRAASYDAVAATPGAFAEYRSGIDFLLERRVPFVVKSVRLPPNRADSDALETWAAGIPWMEREVPYILSLDLRARRDSARKNQQISGLRLTPDEVVGLLARDQDAYRAAMREFCLRFVGPQGDGLVSCGAGSSVYIDAYGIAQMCTLLRHPEMVFDLKEGTLRTALTEAFPRFRERRTTNTDYLRRCACCFLGGLCEQCPGKSWTEHGTLDTPVEYLCEVAHAQARWLGLLEAGELAWEVRAWQDRIARLAGTRGARPETLPNATSAGSGGGQPWAAE